MNTPHSSLLIAEIPESMDGMRLDQALANLFSEFSRSRLQQWIRDGLVEVDEKNLKPRDRVYTGQQVTLQVIEQQQGDWQAESIPLDIVYEDAAIIVLDKAPGMVVHPAAGNYSGTMLNALLHHAPELANVPRAGIVHRLDKDTSGLLVVARDINAHKSLVEQLQARSFDREYLAVVNGVMAAGGTVDAAIGRHPVQRTRMAVVSQGKPAVTHYRVEERYRAHSLLRVKLETGRTHQIRVHMAYLHYPIVGDPVYGGRLKLPTSCSSQLTDVLRNFRRQALHATSLGITHPVSNEYMQWQSLPPADMQLLVDTLRQDVKEVTRE